MYYLSICVLNSLVLLIIYNWIKEFRIQLSFSCTVHMYPAYYELIFTYCTSVPVPTVIIFYNILDETVCHCRVLEWQDCKVTVDFFFIQEQFQVPKFLAELGTIVLFRYGSSVLRPSIFFMSQKSYSCFRNDEQWLHPELYLSNIQYMTFLW